MEQNPATLALTCITNFASFTDDRAETAVKGLLLKLGGDLEEGYVPSSLMEAEMDKYEEAMNEIERDLDESGSTDEDDEDEDDLRDIDSDEDSPSST